MKNFHETMRAGSKTGNPMRQLGIVTWLGQRTNHVRAERRRAIKAAGGIRQHKKAQRLHRYWASDDRWTEIAADQPFA
jgi:hypothetical protein